MGSPHHKPPTPKSLILNLLLACNGAPLSASDAVTSASLFGIRENSVRVALVRLAASGLLQSSGRGAYQLGQEAATLAGDLSRWRGAEQRVCDWTGGWLMVSTAGLGRSERGPLRQRERALALLGFRALSDGLHVRPDNLIGHASLVRSRLHTLGLDAQAPVFVARELDADLERHARSLWQTQSLNQTYARVRQQLERWVSQADQLDLETAARESYLLGNDAIRQLVFDPLLPEPLVDVAARVAFHQAVVAFDAAGRRIWQRLLPSLRPADGITDHIADHELLIREQPRAPAKPAAKPSTDTPLH